MRQAVHCAPSFAPPIPAVDPRTAAAASLAAACRRLDCLALSFLDARQRPGQACRARDQLVTLSSLFCIPHLRNLLLADNRGTEALTATAETALVRVNVCLCMCLGSCASAFAAAFVALLPPGAPANPGSIAALPQTICCRASGMHPTVHVGHVAPASFKTC